MSKFYKTTGGEVYGKCGITFGAEPVEVSDAALARKTERGIVGERLAADARLTEVAAPAPKAEAEVKTETNDQGGRDAKRERPGK